MKSDGITTILLGFITALGLITVAASWIPAAPAAEIQHVQFGSTVTLGCNISYIYDTTWLKHHADFTPTVVLCASFREGLPVQECQLSPRFSVELMNRSLALMITGIEEGDLGLYYCIASVNMRLTVGTGTMLQVSSSDSVPLQFLMYHWFCVVVGFFLFVMMLTVCIIHWKVK